MLYGDINSLPEHTRIVGKRAFADCLGLRHVYVPDDIESIAKDAFEGVPEGLVFHGESGGYAEYYANRYGFAFRTE